MNKENVKTLADLVKQSAAEYGEKAFMQKKSGTDITELSFRGFR